MYIPNIYLPGKLKAEYIAYPKTYININCRCKHNTANHLNCGEYMLGLTLVLKFSPDQFDNRYVYSSGESYLSPLYKIRQKGNIV